MGEAAQYTTATRQVDALEVQARIAMELRLEMTS